jgi:hypothetical protein
MLITVKPADVFVDAATSTVPNRQQSASVTMRPSRSIRWRPSPGHGGSSRQ